MTPDPMRATAERLARDIATAINKHSAELDSDTPDFILADAMTAMLDAMQRAIVARDDWYGGKPGPKHRDRTAEREAASKALMAFVQHCIRPGVDLPLYRSAAHEVAHPLAAQFMADYLAAEFDAGERVTLCDGSVVTRGAETGRWWRRYANGTCTDARGSWRDVLDAPTDTGADFDKLKAFAAKQRGAER